MKKDKRIKAREASLITSAHLPLWSFSLFALSFSLGCGETDRLASASHPPVSSPSAVTAEDESPESLKYDAPDHRGARAPLPGGIINGKEHMVFFAPDDPTLSLELGLIDRVINDCSERERPSECKIRYAVYNLTSALITQRLIKAAQAGVRVQVLIDARQLSQARAWNQINERFLESGLSVEYDHRILNDAERARTHLIGVDGSGLMHLKMRLFETPSWRRLLTGSLNPNTTAHLNDETLHLIADEGMIYQYHIAYETLLYHWPLQNEWHPEVPVNVLFTPVPTGERAVNRIFEWLAEEQEQILLMVFALRDLTAEVDERSLSELLIAKAEAGIPVYIITDRKQSDGHSYVDGQSTDDDELEDRLRAGGIPVYEALNDSTPYTAMHHKAAILGRSRIRVISGAANWSRAGLGTLSRAARNIESVLFIDSYALDQNFTGHRFIGQWMRTLWRYGHQSEAVDEERPAEEIFAHLSASKDWPSARFSFEVSVRSTPAPVSLAVTGDLEQLGWWGTRDIHLLEEEGASALWRSPMTLSAALGTPLSWKIVSLEQGRVKRWEPRRHRDEVLSVRFKPGEETIFRGVW